MITCDSKKRATMSSPHLEVRVSGVVNAPMSLPEVLTYLPNFDPFLDPFMGGWVMMSSTRSSALLDPLIKAWEENPANPSTEPLALSSGFAAASHAHPSISPTFSEVSAASPMAGPAEPSIPESEEGVTPACRPLGITWTPPARLPLVMHTAQGTTHVLAPLSLTKATLLMRKRTRPRRGCGSDDDGGWKVVEEDEEAQQSDAKASTAALPGRFGRGHTVQRQSIKQSTLRSHSATSAVADANVLRSPLYLNIRYGLLTRSIPPAFGGCDVLEVVTCEHAPSVTTATAIPASPALRTVLFPVEGASSKFEEASDEEEVDPLGGDLCTLYTAADTDAPSTGELQASLHQLHQDAQRNAWVYNTFQLPQTAGQSTTCSTLLHEAGGEEDCHYFSEPEGDDEDLEKCCMIDAPVDSHALWS